MISFSQQYFLRHHLKRPQPKKKTKTVGQIFLFGYFKFVWLNKSACFEVADLGKYDSL